MMTKGCTCNAVVPADTAFTNDVVATGTIAFLTNNRINLFSTLDSFSPSS